MRYGDVYRHFKQKDYLFIGIAVPRHLFINEDGEFDEIQVAKREDTQEIVNTYLKDGVLYSSCEDYMVLYESMYDGGTRWLRRVDDFFGYKQDEEEKWIKRFEQMERKE